MNPPIVYIVSWNRTRMQVIIESTPRMVTNGIHVNQMPPEMLSMIFSYLKLPELVKSVLPVCKQWHEIANGPLFWQHLQFGPGGTTEDVLKVFEKSTFVKTIQLNRRTDIGQIVQEVYKRCSSRYDKVEEIVVNMCCTLHKCCDSPTCHQLEVVDDVPYGTNMIDLCSSLKKLTLINIQSKDLIGTNLRMITELTILRCHHFSPSDLKLIVENCTELTCIAILHNALESAGNSTAWDESHQELLIKKGPFLQVLRINARYVSDSTLQDLSILTRLHTLTLENATHLSGGGILAISTLRYLDHLHIDQCPDIHDESLADLFAPGNLCNLKTLTLTKCDGLTDECLDIISNSCPRLRKVDFSDCWLITDEGLELIFMRCLKLRCLNLSNAVGVLGSSFEIIPQTIPNMKLLIIGAFCCEGKERFLQDLGARMPTLEIKR